MRRASCVSVAHRAKRVRWSWPAERAERCDMGQSNGRTEDGMNENTWTSLPAGGRERQPHTHGTTFLYFVYTQPTTTYSSRLLPAEEEGRTSPWVYVCMHMCCYCHETVVGIPTHTTHALPAPPRHRAHPCVPSADPLSTATMSCMEPLSAAWAARSLRLSSIRDASLNAGTRIARR